ncbi:hypothetical protein [Janthinobacterium tructae]
MSTRRFFEFRRQIANLKTNYETIHLPEIERATAAAQKKMTDALKGQGRTIVREAQVRQYLLDPTLTFLGWDLGNPSAILVEDAVDAAKEGEHRRFMDYHGKEMKPCGVDTSLLIVEAKRPSVLLPGPSITSSENLSVEIVNAFAAIRSGKSKCKHFTADWFDRLNTLADYTTRVKQQSGDAPSRVVITNGEWFIVFLNPESALIGKNPSADEVLVFQNLDEVAERANEFCESLEYASLSSKIPTQHPTDLQKFASIGEDVRAALAVELSFNVIGNIQPSMAVRVYARVRTMRGVWIKFRKDYEPPYEIMPGKQDAFIERIGILQELANDLIAELRKYANVTVMTPNEAELVAADDGMVSGWHSSALNSSPSPELHYLTLGDGAFYVTSHDAFDDCSFHSFGPCLNAGSAATTQPIIRQSRTPPVYFPSGSKMHCAHKNVHAGRDGKCILQSFETHMCCQRCTYLTRCWPNGTDALPCAKK